VGFLPRSPLVSLLVEPCDVVNTAVCMVPLQSCDSVRAHKYAWRAQWSGL
jgi:hypothetical protein